MNASWMLSAAMVLAGQLVAGCAVAAPLGGADVASKALLRHEPGLLLVQVQDSGTQHRMSRLWQNRSIIENALRAPRQEQMETIEPIQPQPRALQPREPEPEHQAIAEAEEQLSCDTAAGIVEDYGFSDVRMSGCGGELYRFSASRDGTAYSIGIDADSGKIAEVRRE